MSRANQPGLLAFRKLLAVKLLAASKNIFGPKGVPMQPKALTCCLLVPETFHRIQLGGASRGNGPEKDTHKRRHHNRHDGRQA